MPNMNERPLEKRTIPKSYLFRILFTVFMIAAILISLDVEKKELLCTEETTGIVTALDWRNTSNHNMKERKWSADVEYQVNGVNYAGTLTIKTSRKADSPWTPGQETTLYYNPDRPKSIITTATYDWHQKTSSAERRFTHIAMVIAGVGLAVGLGSVFDRKRAKARLERSEKDDSGKEANQSQNIPIGFWLIVLLITVAGLGIKLLISGSFSPGDIFAYFIGAAVFFSGAKEMCKPKTPFVIRLLILIFFGMYLVVFVFRTERFFVPTILFTICSSFVLMAIGLLQQEKGIRKNCTVRTVATVTGNQKETMRTRRTGEMDRISYTYHPVLCYYVNGDRKELAYIHGLPSPMELDSRIEILYNPRKPEEFCFLDADTKKNGLVVAYIILAVGVLLGIVSVFILFLMY